jgi:hypothetical protein
MYEYEELQSELAVIDYKKKEIEQAKLDKERI